MLTLNLATASALEKAVNKLIVLDPDAFEKLNELADKRIAIELNDWQLTYVFEIFDNHIAINTQKENDCHVTMKGTSFAFFNMANSERGGDVLFKGEVHFEGEVSTAQKFQNFWQSLNIDWEEELSKYTGDVVAHQLGRIANHAQKTIKSIFSTAQQNFSEYVREEARMSPTHFEVDDFLNDVDDLKSDVNRLEAKIEQLKSKV